MPVSRSDLIKFAPGRFNNQTTWEGGEQQQLEPYSEQGIRGLAFVAGTGAVGAGTYYGLKSQGINAWDYVYKAARTAEEFSPLNVLRTFQIGDFVSQFTTSGNKSLDIAASTINPNSLWFKELVNRAGPNAQDALSYGLQFKDNKLFAGNTQLLEHATKMTQVGNPFLSAAYARVNDFGALNTMAIPDSFQYKRQLPGSDPDLLESIFFTGVRPGEGKSKAVLNQVRMIASESIERANRLADAPFGAEPFTTGLAGFQKFWEDKFSTRFTLAVRPGTVTQLLGRMGMKWGIGGTAAYLGYQTADWAVRNTPLLNPTIFDQGITAGIATIGTKLNLAAATIADLTPGVRSYRDTQEEWAPGSTSLTKLAAFPITGAALGGTAYYLQGVMDKAKATKQLMSEGLSYTEALPLANNKWLKESTSYLEDNAVSRALVKRFGKKIPFIGEVSKAKAFAAAGAAILTIPILPFLPGALIPGKTAEELEDIYSGRQEVEVKKGRFWELGRSPFEGTKIDYFRPHWYARMMQRSKQKSLYPDDPNPIAQWFKENFTYDMEREHYYDRPYPITGTAFEEIPILGPLLGATIGRLIKPPKLMHTNEWMGAGSENQDSVLRTPGRAGENPLTGEETPRGTPVSPGDTKQVLGEQAYRLTELSGLWGFTFSSLKGMITGSEEFFDQEERLQQASRMYGGERTFWDLNMGGALFTNELFRRWLPHRRRQIEEYNPIRNTMPSWMPGAGDRSHDFLHGDPFTKIQEGEVRLPGEGFAARFPELAGMNPEDYPLVYQYKILSDVAPYSDKTKRLQGILSAQAANGTLDEYQASIFAQAKNQMKRKKGGKEFYQFEVTEGESNLYVPGESALQSRENLSILNEALASKRENKLSLGRELIGGYWETMVKAAQGPQEALIPFAPASKFIGIKSALQDYKQTQVFGPDIAFWQNPIENFIKPFARETLDLFGSPDVPEGVQNVRSFNEYFDILKYVKNKYLAEAARDAGVDSGAYEQQARETLIGVNPYNRDFATLFRALPASERDYFDEFSTTTNPEEREEILRLAPPGLKRIYTGLWEQQYTDTLNKAVAGGLISEQAAAEDLDAYYKKVETQGMPIDEDLEEEYKASRTNQSYADWYKQNHLIPLMLQGEGLPGADWVGWHPAVDLEEVKLKIVKNEGMDIHDFNLWPSDERSAERKPFVDIAARQLVDEVNQNPTLSTAEVQKQVRELLGEIGISHNAKVSVYELPDGQEKVRIDFDSEENPNEKLKEELRKRLREN